jgi:uncharacterized protein YbaR (Trm112 family)
MRLLLLDHLVCPLCLPKEKSLNCRVERKAGEDVIQGELECRVCGKVYPIRKGIANMLPGKEGSRVKGRKYESDSVLASYLWAHYGDILGEEHANSCYGDWAALLSEKPGLWLDAGCAAGRFTFEMGRKADFAVGMDASFPFVEAARRLMTDRRLTFSLPMEGGLSESRSISIPSYWEKEKAEFVVGDVQAVPFRAQSFASVASLNMLDKVSHPLQHLYELNRVANSVDAQLVVSDPFSWSEEVSPRDRWLGGTRQGAFAGRALENLERLLEEGVEAVHPPWKVSRTGHVWWRIRNHRNHFELIRSWFVKACR